METEEIRRSCETIHVQEEYANQVVHVVMVDQVPEPGQFEEGLANCMFKHDDEIISQRENPEGFNENEKKLLRSFLINVRNQSI